METVAKSKSKRMYSWWWDSHNTPKNSKWLQDNLADMDNNVKQMIKVLEEDADSFAKRAEMYYRKRPELLKLVEEFYRAYRALAERYNHATGVIHQAQQTIAEAFPNQVPEIFGDESSHDGALINNDVDPQTPEMLQIQDFEGPYVSSGKARKGLNFNEGSNNDLKAKILSESERASKAEAEVVSLKESISEMQAEKEANLVKFVKNLERLSNLESEVSLAQEESRGLNDRAASAEAEIETLRESLYKLESEKESSLVWYQQCLQKIADLEDGISVTHKDAAKAESDKEAALVQYKECLKTISNLEERLRKSEEEARVIIERAEKAEVEVENLKRKVSKLVEDNEASELQYQQCLNIIAGLKLKLYHAQEETQSLSHEVEDGVAKLKFSEEKCLVLEKSNQNLHSELDVLLEKLGNQSQKLTEKQTELVKLWSCVQEEHLRFQEAETAFQTLQQLHSQSQDELTSLAVELQTKSQIMKDMEMRNNELHEDIQKANELNLSSVASVKSLQEDVSSLKETRQKLEAEVKLRVDQRNALQQEIYCLKDELSQVGKEHQSMVGSSETMETLVQKNLMLEKSISDLNFELESIRKKLKTLEEACKSLSEENSCLISENHHSAIENIVLVEWLRQLKLEAVSIETEKKKLEGKAKKSSDQLREKEKELEEIKVEKEKLNQEVFIEKSNAELWESQAATFFIDKQIEATRRELSEACNDLESSQAIVLLNESIKSLEDNVFVRRKSHELSKEAESMNGVSKLEEMCLRIKAIGEAVMEKEKFMMLENANAYSMLEASLKQIKGSGRSMRKQEGGSGRTRKQSYEIEMVMKDIVLDQTSDGSSYEIVSKKGTSELDLHGFVELKPVKTHKTASSKGKSLSEESLIVDKLEIFDGFMDPNVEVNKRKVLERLDSDLRKLENIQITVEDLKSKVETVEMNKKKEKVGGGDDEYETIKGQLEEAEEAIEKLFNVNRKLTTKAESEKDLDRRRRISEQARRGSEKLGRLQLEIQRIQFLLMKLEGEKENRAKSKILDSNSKVLLRDYIYGRTRSVTMKKKTKKRSVFCGCVQQPLSP